MTDYVRIATEIGKLVTEKQAAYGDSVGNTEEILAILYPDGVPISAYADLLLMVRVLDKLSRIATDKDALGESPWGDVAGYGVLGVTRGERG